MDRIIKGSIKHGEGVMALLREAGKSIVLDGSATAEAEVTMFRAACEDLERMLKALTPLDDPMREVGTGLEQTIALLQEFAGWHHVGKGGPEPRCFHCDALAALAELGRYTHRVRYGDLAPAAVPAEFKVTPPSYGAAEEEEPAAG